MMESTENITCQFLEGGEVLNCSGTLYMKDETIKPDDQLFWIYLGVYIGLVLIAGLMSGLTMGLLSLDVMSLNVLQVGGKPHEIKHAKRILPLVKKHHLLLVTLLLANAAAVESMPLFLDRISNPVTAIVISVTAVLLFGEVIPQAICTRYGLAIGSYLSPFVYFLVGITFPISWPISKLLDCLLGTEHGTFFRRAELKALVEFHKTEQVEANEEPLSPDEAMIIQGALSMTDKFVKQICTPKEYIFYISLDSTLNSELMDKIIKRGHSRIPVLDKENEKFVGMLLVKNLIKIDPDKNLLVRDVFNSGYKRTIYAVTGDTMLYDCLNLFQATKSHLFIVVSHQFGLADNQAKPLDSTCDLFIGIVTLEDVIEELIQEEIIDETDVYVDISKKVKVAKARARKRTASKTFGHTSSSQSQANVFVHDENLPLLKD